MQPSNESPTPQQRPMFMIDEFYNIGRAQSSNRVHIVADSDNPYIREMEEKMFPWLDDSPTVMELLNQYRDTLTSPDYDMF